MISKLVEPKTVDTRPAWLKQSQPFVLGGLSGCFATTIIQPIDMVKVQLQLLEKTAGVAQRSPLSIAKEIVKDKGFLGLYRGLDAGLLRQITYTTSRMGLFRLMSDLMKSKEEKTLPLRKKAIAGLAAGGIGSLIGTPADLALIRLQSDTMAPVHMRRGYTGVINALTRISSEEGFFSMWKGAYPTVARAMALNMGMLASFDQSKEFLDEKFGPGWNSTLSASAISGFVSVTFSLPFDYVKTRIQRMKMDPITHKYPYKNMTDCAIKTFKNHGIMEFYKGYFTYYLRIAPHIMITLITLDYTNKAINKIYTKNA